MTGRDIFVLSFLPWHELKLRQAEAVEKKKKTGRQTQRRLNHEHLRLELIANTSDSDGAKVERRLWVRASAVTTLRGQYSLRMICSCAASSFSGSVTVLSVFRLTECKLLPHRRKSKLFGFTATSSGRTLKPQNLTCNLENILSSATGCNKLIEIIK